MAEHKRHWVRYISLVLISVLLLISALLLSARALYPQLDRYKPELQTWLGERLGMAVTIDELETRWEGLSPQLHLAGVSLSADSRPPAVSAQFQSLDLRLNLFQSLLVAGPVIESLHLDGLQVQWYQREGRWLAPAQSQVSQQGGMQLGRYLQQAWLMNLLQQQEQIQIEPAVLVFQPQGQPAKRFWLDQFRVTKSDSDQQLELMLRPEGAEQAYAQLVLESATNDWNPLAHGYEVYLSVENFSSDWLPPLPQQLATVALNGQLWGSIREGRLDSLNGHLNLTGQLGQQVLNGSHAAVALLHRKDSRYQLQLQNLQLAGQPRPAIEQLALDLDLSRPQPLTAVEAPQISLHDLHTAIAGLAIVPETAQRVLKGLAPEGELRNLLMIFDQPDDWRSFELAADLYQLGVNARWGAPELRGVSGYLQADGEGGSIHLRSDDFTLNFPELFDKPWRYPHAQGRVSWQLDEQGVLVNSELLELQADQLNARGRFNIALPFDRSQPSELTLMIGMTDSDGSSASDYVPRRELGEAFHSWLDSAVQAGHIRQAGLLLHGNTRREKGVYRRPTVQLFFDLDQVDFAYQPGWPALTQAELFMLVRDQGLQVDLHQAQLLNSRLQDTWAYMAPASQQLEVISQLEGPAQDIEYLLKQTPIRAQLGAAVDPWQLSGRNCAAVALGIDLTGKAAPRIDVQAQLDAGRLQAPAYDLDFQGLSGKIRYSSEQGLSAPAIKGRFLEQPVTARINTQDERTRIRLQGAAALRRLQGWTGLGLLGVASGMLNYQAELALCPQTEPGCNRLRIDSDLQGVVLPLPAPLGKTAAQSQPLTLLFKLADEVWRLNYADQLRGVFKTTPQLRAALLLGGERPQSLPDAAGVWLSGQLDYLNETGLDQLLALADQADGSDIPEAEAAGAGLQAVELNIKRFEYAGIGLDELRAHLDWPQPNQWRLAVEHPQLAGEILAPQQEQGPYQVALSRLKVDQSLVAATGGGEQAQMFQLDDWVPLDLALNNLSYAGHDYGRWSMQLRPQGRVLDISHIDGQLAGARIRGNGRWVAGKDPISRVDLNLEAADIGPFLERIGYGRTLANQETRLNARLTWRDNIWQPDAASLNGSLDLLAKDGRLLDAGGGNALRIFGILNFNTWARRLKLDFSDLYREGVAFDRIEAHYRIAEGVASTVEPVTLTGPAMSMKMQGQADLAKRTLNQEMQVSVPVSSNVPLAALLLGAPQVAGAAFLLDKLVGDPLEQVSSLTYQISGSLDNPKVELKKAGN